MEIDIKKNLSKIGLKSYKMLFVTILKKLKKKQKNLFQQNGKKIKTKMKVVESIEFWRMEKYLIKLE